MQKKITFNKKICIVQKKAVPLRAFLFAAQKDGLYGSVAQLDRATAF